MLEEDDAIVSKKHAATVNERRNAERTVPTSLGSDLREVRLRLRFPKRAGELLRCQTRFDRSPLQNSVVNRPCVGREEGIVQEATVDRPFTQSFRCGGGSREWTSIVISRSLNSRQAARGTVLRSSPPTPECLVLYKAIDIVRKGVL